MDIFHGAHGVVGTNDEVVDVQISVNYDVEGGILGQANYEGRVSLSVIVEDINNGTP